MPNSDPNERLPVWARVSTLAMLSFLVLYLLGAVPGMSSPIDRILGKLEAHDASTQEAVKLMRQICYNTSRLAQEWRCDKGG